MNRSKSWLIVKTEELEKEAELIFIESVIITTNGKRHVGSVIGLKIYEDTYSSDKVKI